MRIYVWEDTSIQTYQEVVQAYLWCCRNLGEPGEGRWTYGKSIEGLGGDLISHPMEIEYFDFEDDQDASAFKLVY